MPEQKISKHYKMLVAARANYYCEYCKCLKSFVPGPFHIDHIVPSSKGGNSNLKNLAYACNGCNGHKYQKTHAADPLTGEMVELFHPRNNQWKKHFKWSNDFLLVEGLTSTGRATIEAMYLNRMELVNLRAVLSEIGKHPPKETL
jgi:5-methylcytosine-specific restriction endonuclease McrA